MNSKERILRILDGKPPDRMPWAPRLELWYRAHSAQGTLPERYRGLDLAEVEKKLGGAAGSTARLKFSYLEGGSSGHFLGARWESVQVETETTDDSRRIRYKTPVGAVEEVYRYKRRAADRGLPFEEHIVEYPLQSAEDYRVLEYIFRDLQFTADYAEYEGFAEELGTHGVPIVGLDWDPMFLIMRGLLGLNNFYYEFMDHKDRIECLYRVICEKFRSLQELVLDSPARIILSALHYDYRTVPPYFYREYMQPVLQPFAEKLRARGKLMGLHADADLKELVVPLYETGFTFMDCFVCAPMVSLTLEEALEVWGDEVVLYGCIPSNLLIPSICPEREFREYIAGLMDTLETIPCRVILGIADNVMPEADIGRVEYLARLFTS